MYTLETVIVIPAILIFIATSICVSLGYTEIAVINAEKQKTESLKSTVSYSDVVRGGEVLRELYKEYIQ